MSDPYYGKYPGYGYDGSVYLDDRLEWIRDHSFASISWMESKVRYSKWEHKPDGSFDIIVKEIMGSKTLTILIQCRHYPKGGPHCPYPDYVHVFNSHVLRKK